MFTVNQEVTGTYMAKSFSGKIAYAQEAGFEKTYIIIKLDSPITVFAKGELHKLEMTVTPDGKGIGVIKAQVA